MAFINYILCLVFLLTLCLNTNVTGDIAARASRAQQLLSHDDYYTAYRVNKIEKVKIRLYYETFCMDCRMFDSTKFKQVVTELNKYLIIKTYPYGNAQTTENNGKYEFKCQHGPGECYGNMLHACALDIIQNQTEALLYNSCMMDMSQEGKGSDDEAADKCGQSMKIDSEPIKLCAKGEKGVKLLKYYGDQSAKANYKYVPYILVNGKESDGDNFMKEICAAYSNLPPPCAPAVK